MLTVLMFMYFVVGSLLAYILFLRSDKSRIELAAAFIVGYLWPVSLVALVFIEATFRKDDE